MRKRKKVCKGVNDGSSLSEKIGRSKCFPSLRPGLLDGQSGKKGTQIVLRGYVDSRF